MKKSLITYLFLSVVLSSNVLARDAEIINQYFGKTPQDKECSLTIMKMYNWEGQIGIFLKGPNGDFRIEIKESSWPLETGSIDALYSNTDIKYKKGILSQSQSEWVSTMAFKGYERKKIKIQISPRLEKPVSAAATQKFNFSLEESVNCQF